MSIKRHKTIKTTKKMIEARNRKKFLEQRAKRLKIRKDKQSPTSKPIQRKESSPGAQD
jgi:hypothetical protein